MREKIKNTIRKTLISCKLDITKNLQYDRLTETIMHQVLSKNSNAIDVGAHKGEILETIIHLAPQGKHYAFEPIPYLYKDLQQRFLGQAEIHNEALSDKEGKTKFYLVENAPAYSGLKKRKYAISNPEISEIEVTTSLLDNIIPENLSIDFMKIDVEGGEFGVLKGAERILAKDQPYIVFECGLGASDYYETDPLQLYHFIKNFNLQISTLNNFVKGKSSLAAEAFCEYYKSNKEYYFIIHPNGL